MRSSPVRLLADPPKIRDATGARLGRGINSRRKGFPCTLHFFTQGKDLSQEVVMVAAQSIRLPGERGPCFIDLGKQFLRILRDGPMLPQRRVHTGESVSDSFRPFPLLSGNVLD